MKLLAADLIGAGRRNDERLALNEQLNPMFPTNAPQLPPLGDWKLLTRVATAGPPLTRFVPLTVGVSWNQCS